MKRFLVVAAVLAVAAVAAAGEMRYQTSARLSDYFEKARENLPTLVAFLHKMPKGGDLHNHPLGAMNTESIVRIAAEKGMYFDRENLSFSTNKPDGPFYAPEEFTENYWKQGEIIQALSLRDLELAGESGHDRFFRAFDRFGIAMPNEIPAYKELMRRALNQEIAYLELMTLPTADADWAETVEKIRREAIQEFADKGLERQLEVRYIYPLVRTSILAKPDIMREQVDNAFAAARAMPDLFLGVTILAPEDDPQSQKYFLDHMKIIEAGLLDARRKHEEDPANNPPAPKLMLHAGELTMEIATYESMTDRIATVLEIGRASRIGHGTSIMWEDDVYGVLKRMRDLGIAQEFCPSSAEKILKVSGKNHPYPLYRAAGVPVVIATDDEGVARSNLTLEYAKAAQWFDLPYPEIKWLAFNSIEYSFLPGESYFLNADYNLPRADADIVAAASQKARMQKYLLDRFAEFERSMENTLDAFGW